MVARRPLIFGVVGWGDPTSAGLYDATYCTLGGVAKSEPDPSVTCLTANEYVCNRLALALGLPVPPGAFIRTVDRSVAFVSLRFGSLTESIPPVIPADLARDQPLVAGGIIAFDCWIRNSDRHTGNLAYRKGVIPPTMFDHGLCLGGESRSGIAGLSNEISKPGYPHCLSAHIKTARHLENWLTTIKALPLVTMTSILEEVVSVNLLTSREAKMITAFLRHRQMHLHSVLQQTLSHLPDWGLL